MSVLRSLPTRSSLVATVAAIIIGLLAAANAGAEPIVGPGGPSGAYDFASEASCTGKKSDPVGVLFRGRHAGPTNVSAFITDETWYYSQKFAGTQMAGAELLEP